DVSWLLMHPRTHAVQAAAFTRARNEWKVIDPAVEADFAALATIHDGDFTVQSRDHADKTWVVSYTSDKVPTRYYLYDRATKQGSFLFSSRPELDTLP